MLRRPRSRPGRCTRIPGLPRSAPSADRSRPAPRSALAALPARGSGSSCAPSSPPTPGQAWPLRLIEQVADGEAPARHDVLATERVVHAERAHGLARTVHRDRPPAGIDHEHESGTVLQPLRDLLIYLGV